MKHSLSFFIGIIFFIFSPSAFAVTDSFTNPEDSYVRESSPTVNYGDESVLLADGVAQDPDNPNFGELVTLIKWDISSIPSTATVTAASVTLNLFNSSGGPYNIVQQLSPWSQATVNWNDLSTSNTVGGLIPAGSSGLVTINLNAAGIAMIQGWVLGTQGNNGLAIRSAGTNDGIGFDSVESAGSPPLLEVTYTNDGQPTLESLQAKIDQLTALLQGVSRNGDVLLLSGMNLQIVNGLGATNGNPESPEATREFSNVNGLGNLIVGYDEPIGLVGPFAGEPVASNKSGSHNVVIGHGHNYSSFGGLVVGRDNNIMGAYSSVTGGTQNKARAAFSSVSGGEDNRAEDFYSSISGGQNNTTAENWSSISGGDSNTTQGEHSSISGGRFNTTTGTHSSISGGASNVASGRRASISGGLSNAASGVSSNVSGGSFRTASGTYDWAAGSLSEDN